MKSQCKFTNIEENRNHPLTRRLVIIGLLQLVRLLAEQRLPNGVLDEDQNVDQPGLPLELLVPDEDQVQ